VGPREPSPGSEPASAAAAVAADRQIQMWMAGWLTARGRAPASHLARRLALLNVRKRASQVAVSVASRDRLDAVKVVGCRRRAPDRAARRAVKEAPAVATRTGPRAGAGSPLAPVAGHQYRRDREGRAATTLLPSASSRRVPATPLPPRERRARDGRTVPKAARTADARPARAFPKQRDVQLQRPEGPVIAFG